MANIYSIISSVCFVLAAVCLVAAIIIFFLLDVKGAYIEKRGLTDIKWLTKQKKTAKNKIPKTETPTEKFEDEVEAPTIMGDGNDIKRDFLVGVYEPGTEKFDGDDERTTDFESQVEKTTTFEEEEQTTELNNESFEMEELTENREEYNTSDFVILQKEIHIEKA